mgnify:CR=1 FL=1
MRLSDIKGQDAFKAMGSIVGCLRDMFSDERILQIVNEKKKGWMLDFFSVSLEERSDLWMRMYLVLNPDTKEEDVSVGSVIKFAYDFKNDPELMSLFFSQSEQTENSSSGSLTENTKVTDLK